MDKLKNKLRGWTSVHEAAQLGDAAGLERIIARHAKEAPEYLNKQTKDTLQSPLHVACALGHADVVAVLLKHGACIGMLDEDSRTPLHMAALSGNKECITALFAHVLMGAADKMHCLQARDKAGNDALILAVQGGHVHCVKELAAQGADVHASCDESGAGLMHIAARRGDIGMMKALSQYINIHARQAAGQRAGDTLLHVAATAGRTAAAVWLIKEGGVDYMARDAHGYTALELALLEKHKETHAAIRDTIACASPQTSNGIPGSAFRSGSPFGSGNSITYAHYSGPVSSHHNNYSTSGQLPMFMSTGGCANYGAASTTSGANNGVGVGGHHSVSSSGSVSGGLSQRSSGSSLLAAHAAQMDELKQARLAHANHLNHAMQAAAAAAMIHGAHSAQLGPMAPQHHQQHHQHQQHLAMAMASQQHGVRF